MDPASSALRDLEEALEVGTPDEVVAAAAALRQVVAARAGAEPARALLGQLLAVAEAGAAMDRGEAARVCAQVRAAGLGADAPPAPPPPPADAGPDGWTVGADSADMLADFAVEARGLLDEAEGACLALDHGITPAAIAMAFRAFHTIKGVAGFLELTVLATVAHRIESVLSEVRDGAPPPDGFVDLILRSIDVVRAGVAVAARGGAGARPDVDGLLREIEAALAGLAQRTTESQPTIMLPVIPQAATRAIRIDDLDERAVVKVDITKMDHIIDLVGELAIAQAQVAGHPALAAIGSRELGRAISLLGRVAKELQHASLAMRMVALKGTFDRMARIARDTARGLAKPLAFVVEGGPAKAVTSVSGRGVGMDVVKTKIEQVRGRVEITSTPGRGTTVRLRLPLTLAIIDGLLLRVGAERFVMPTSWAKDLFRPTADQLVSVRGRGQMVKLRGAVVPIVHSPSGWA